MLECRNVVKGNLDCHPKIYLTLQIGTATIIVHRCRNVIATESLRRDVN